MDNHIVNEPSKKIREIGRNAAKGNWWRLYLGILIYMGVAFGASFLVGLVGNFIPMYRYIVMDRTYYLVNLTNIFTIPLIWVVMAPLMLGLFIFMLKAFRTRQISYKSLFGGYKIFLKTLGLVLLMAVKILAWSLLLIIPGIIAMFRYSMSMYLLADNPDWKVTQCINESKRLMNGNKGKLFCLGLSFIGWFLLWYLFIFILLFIAVVISVVAFQAMLYQAYYIISAIAIILIPIVIITIIPLMTYMYMTFTAFYELVTGNLVVVGDKPVIASKENEKENEFGRSYESEAQKNMFESSGKDDFHDKGEL